MTTNGLSLDYYAVLQVHPDADFEVIEAAYRQLMKKHHPDMAGDDRARIAENEDRAKRINQAFAVLRDPERRRRYDLERLIVGTVRPPDRRARAQTWSSPPSTESQTSSPGSARWQAGASSRSATPPPSATSPAAPPPPNGTASSSAPPNGTTSSSASPNGTTWSSAPPNGTTSSSAPPNGTTSSSAQASAEQPDASYAPPPRGSSWLLAPLNWLAAAYYLLPGPYEWEGGRTRELTTVFLLPPTAIAAFLLASGRLTPLIGHTLSATIAAWAILALIAGLLMWGSLLRVAIAAAPSAALLSGLFTPLLQGSHIPVWLAWSLLSCLSLIFAARLFIFAVLPTLVIILLIS